MISTNTNKRVKRIIPKRKLDSNKGNFGHVFIIAGSPGFTGAAYLCGQATLLSGSGLVTVGIPKSLNVILAKKLTEVMTKPLPETKMHCVSYKALDKILEFSKKVDVLAMGPGLSQNSQTQKLINKLIISVEKPIVLDADGLNALSKDTRILKRKKSKIVLTPHPGEMARLIKRSVSFIQKNRLNIAKEFAKSFNVTVVLKGYDTVVADSKGSYYVNKTGNPGMASGGTGDVLTGIITSFIGQGIKPFDAAKLAVFIHGLSGDLAKKEKGEMSLVATDLLKYLPFVLKSL